MTFEAFEVVVVPFPFTDRRTTKRRPALVLSDAAVFNARVGHAVMAMITSAKNRRWPLDVPITDLERAGLPAPSVVRMKFFTLDERLVIRKAGTLAQQDRTELNTNMRRLFAIRG